VRKLKAVELKVVEVEWFKDLIHGLMNVGMKNHFKHETVCSATVEVSVYVKCEIVAHYS
jgi:hypothetical protein